MVWESAKVLKGTKDEEGGGGNLGGEKKENENKN